MRQRVQRFQSERLPVLRTLEPIVCGGPPQTRRVHDQPPAARGPLACAQIARGSRALVTRSDDQHDALNPTEQRGGSTPGEGEASDKGPWAAKAAEGVVPAELGGSDAPEELLAEDPELGSSALGQTASSDEPATGSGVDRAAGDRADATFQGGPQPTPAGAEPDLKDAASGPRRPDIDSAA